MVSSWSALPTVRPVLRQRCTGCAEESVSGPPVAQCWSLRGPASVIRCECVTARVREWASNPGLFAWCRMAFEVLPGARSHRRRSARASCRSSGRHRGPAPGAARRARSRTRCPPVLPGRSEGAAAAVEVALPAPRADRHEDEAAAGAAGPHSARSKGAPAVVPRGWSSRTRRRCEGAAAPPRAHPAASPCCALLLRSEGPSRFSAGALFFLPPPVPGEGDGAAALVPSAVCEAALSSVLATVFVSTVDRYLSSRVRASFPRRFRGDSVGQRDAVSGGGVARKGVRYR